LVAAAQERNPTSRFGPLLAPRARNQPGLAAPEACHAEPQAKHLWIERFGHLLALRVRDLPGLAAPEACHAEPQAKHLWMDRFGHSLALRARN
jgi:hypothetical protein